MNNSILIHDNNIPKNLKSIFNDNCIEFEFHNNAKNTLDEYISKNIISILKNKIFDIVYIKDNLSFNYLELYGLVVAYHIRLSEELGVRRFVPIVILSDLDGYTLNRLEPMARILLTKNIFLEKNTKVTVEKYNQKTLTPLTGQEYQTKFLNLIEVESPENSSNHSIANEWAIYRWAEFLNLEGGVIDDNKKTISSMLYFKYLLAKNPIKNNSATLSCGYPIFDGDILYIDDDCDKGWSNILNNYFDETPHIRFKTFKKDLKTTLIEYYPDVVILDLRLIAGEEDSDDIESFKSMEIRRFIENFNPGIQVIIFSATSKSTILEKLYSKYNILGYIKKEHPEDKNVSTKDSFDSLGELVSKGLEKKYLKEIWRIQSRILGLVIFKKDEENFVKIKSEVETIFEILDSYLENKVKFTILTIFKVLELLCDEYRLNGSAYSRITTLFQQNNLSCNDEISRLICTRNFLAHSGNKDELDYNCKKNNSLIEEPTVENILIWFNMLQNIVQEVNNDKINKT